MVGEHSQGISGSGEGEIKRKFALEASILARFVIISGCVPVYDAEQEAGMSRISKFAVLSTAVLFCMGCQSTWDLAVRSETVTVGTDGASGRIAVVYHPGGSPFPKTVVTRLGEELASRGYVVDLMTAYPDIVFEPDIYRALVLGSPVYGAKIRPPINEFVSANAPFAMPVFAVLTGWFGDLYETYDLPALVAFLDQAGVQLAGAVKIVSSADENRLGEQVGLLADQIDKALGNE
jgi:hypothetical protein